MKATETDEVCDFCLRLNGSMPGRPWYDFHVLDTRHNFVVVAALGPLVPGHVMVVSAEHAERMSDLDQGTLADLHQLAIQWAERIHHTWKGSIMLFEHGGRSTCLKASCIAHAHLQILPVSATSFLTPELTRLTSIEELHIFRNMDYILLSDSKRFCVKTDGVEGGQFMRRRIHQYLGLTDRWDYLVYPRLKAMRQTIEALRNNMR